MSAVFCGQVLASTESTSSGQSAASRLFSALPGPARKNSVKGSARENSVRPIRGRPGPRIVLVLPYTILPSRSLGPGRPRMGKNKPVHLLLHCSVKTAPLGANVTAATRGGDEIHSRGGIYIHVFLKNMYIHIYIYTYL